MLVAALLLGAPTAEAQFRLPSPYYRYAAPEGDLRVLVKPRNASVYVDGYFAGIVDEFDGTFQRLHLTPGEHDIVIYLEGYRSLHERLYVSPHTTRKIEGTLEHRVPSDPPEPRPVPIDRPEPRDRFGPPQGRGPLPRRGPPPPDAGRDRPEPPPASTSRFGTLSIRVQPSGAEVLIDGERWNGPTADERLIVQVPDGRHHVEVRREGYERFDTDIEVRRGATEAMNVSLARAR